MKFCLFVIFLCLCDISWARTCRRTATNYAKNVYGPSVNLTQTWSLGGNPPTHHFGVFQGSACLGKVVCTYEASADTCDCYHLNARCDSLDS